MCIMFLGQCILLVIFINILLSQDAIGLRDVILTIEPAIVERLHDSILRCQYDLENDPLYQVKWYRGAHEFYRYTPKDTPKTRLFPVGNITIDTNQSNSTQVVLQNIEFNLSGQFICEVTIDTKPFSTLTDTKDMLVVQLPENPPTINVGREPLDIGDILYANCTSPPSCPPAILKFFLNNITVDRTDIIPVCKSREQNWSDLRLELPLTEFHFTSGRLILQCVAQVYDVYREEAILELKSARHPVPARVSASNSANSIPTYTAFVLTLFSTLLV